MTPTPAGVLGCIADDITGASDLASALVGRGLRVELVFGVPTSPPGVGVDAVVVALKTRTMPVRAAVDEVTAVSSWLRANGVDRIYDKYCSTFDSTPRGNIGPIADALLDSAPRPSWTVHCPAYPANARTVHQGHLFVGDQLLDESGMRDHPLTPMTDSNLVRVLQAQTSHPVALLGADVVRTGVDAVRARLVDLVAGGAVHVIADAATDDDLDVIAAAVGAAPVLAGGAPFGAAVAVAARRNGAAPAAMPPAPAGRAAALAGSASTATQRQIDAFERHGPVLRLRAEDVAAHTAAAVTSALRWAAAQDPSVPVLICADSRPHAVASATAALGDHAATVLEAALASVAQGLVAQGVRRLVVAGGETSGAVAAALGVRRVTVGAAIATGVPWTVSTDPDVALAFKSGNFGGDEFFADAFDRLDADGHWHLDRAVQGVSS